MKLINKPTITIKGCESVLLQLTEMIETKSKTIKRAQEMEEESYQQSEQIDNEIIRDERPCHPLDCNKIELNNDKRVKINYIKLCELINKLLLSYECL